MLLHCTGVNNLYDIFFCEFFKDLQSCFLAFEKNISLMVSADKNNTEVDGEIVDINIEKEFFGDPRDANRSPGFSILHRGVCIDVVHENCYIMCFHVCYLSWICKHADDIN